MPFLKASNLIRELFKETQLIFFFAIHQINVVNQYLRHFKNILFRSFHGFY